MGFSEIPQCVFRTDDDGTGWPSRPYGMKACRLWKCERHSRQ